MMSDELLVLLGKIFLFLLFFVGGYVILFLNVMRTDPREMKYREGHEEDYRLIPKQK